MNTETQERIELPKSSRLAGLFCIGSPGTGKTGLFQNLLTEDAKQGLGICLLDIHRDLTDAFLAQLPPNRLQDVILLDIADTEHPVGLNLYECPNPSDSRSVQYTVNQVMHIFERLYDISRSTPLIAHTIRNTTHTIIANGLTMAEVPRLLLDFAFRKRLVANVKNPQVQLYWNQFEGKNKLDRDREVSATLNKLDELLQPLGLNIVGQAKTTINMREIMDNRKILLVKLDARLHDISSVVGCFIISLILNAAYSRENIPQEKRKQFHVYADEFQNFATEDFAILITEARKYGIGCNLANQNLTQLDEKNKAAVKGCANLVVFRISGEDAQELKTEFEAKPEKRFGEIHPVMQMEEATEEYEVEEWESLEQQQIHEQAISEKLFYMKFYKTLCDCVYSLYDPGKRSDYDSRTDFYFEPYVNPDYSDPRVQNYLLTHIYAPGSTLDKPILRDPNTLFYSFPPDLPTVMEKRLLTARSPEMRTLLLFGPKVGSNDEKIQEIATYLGEYVVDKHDMKTHNHISHPEFLGFLEIKKRGVYRFDPTGQYGLTDEAGFFHYLYQYSRRNELSFTKEEIELSFKDWIKEKRYVPPLYKKIEKEREKVREEIKILGEQEDRAGFFARGPIARQRREKEACYEALDIEYQSLDKKYINMSLYIDNTPSKETLQYMKTVPGVSPFWYTTPFPRFRLWYDKALRYLKSFADMSGYQAINTKDDYFIKVKKERPIPGVYKPVYDRNSVSRGRYLGEEKTPLYNYAMRPEQIESIDNARNRIANELSNLPKFTAKVKVLGADNKAHEYTIKTIAPNRAKAIHDLIEDIQLLNIADGFIREREEVEEEIEKRQKGVSGTESKAAPQRKTEATPQKASVNPPVLDTKLAGNFRRYEKQLVYYLGKISDPQTAINDRDLDLPIRFRLTEIQGDTNAIKTFIRKHRTSYHIYAGKFAKEPTNGLHAFSMCRHCFAIRYGQRAFGLLEDQILPWPQPLPQLLAQVQHPDLKQLVSEDMTLTPQSQEKPDTEDPKRSRRRQVNDNL